MCVGGGGVRSNGHMRLFPGHLFMTEEEVPHYLETRIALTALKLTTHLVCEYTGQKKCVENLACRSRNIMLLSTFYALAVLDTVARPSKHNHASTHTKSTRQPVVYC